MLISEFSTEMKLEVHYQVLPESEDSNRTMLIFSAEWIKFKWVFLFIFFFYY